jgi:Protein of unknown function (DUF2281)
MNARATLIETIESLPDDRIAQIADYVEFIRQREEERKRNWQTTVEAIEAARRGELKTVGDIKGLFDDLHSDDADD